MISNIDSVGLLGYLVNNTTYPQTTLADHFKYEKECLDQVITIEPKADKRLYYVSDIKCTKSITIVSIYEIFSGKTREVKMWTSQYRNNLIMVISFTLFLLKRNIKKSQLVKLMKKLVKEYIVTYQINLNIG